MALLHTMLAMAKRRSTRNLISIALLNDAGHADVQLHLLIFGSTGGMVTTLHLKRLGVSESRKSGQSITGYALESPQKA